MARNRVIGARNRLPWSLPEDLKHFRRTTSGHAVVMGRKTFESIGKPMPNRRNIVISRTLEDAAEDVSVVGSLEEAIESCRGEKEIFVIGGAEIYQLALPRAKRI